ncbi:MAG: guanylate kinase [Lachnospiraceae bacterium]|nr:guanylate kinase [Candidatus Equihabitans merdae]
MNTGHIFYIMGKSASGKDTLYSLLLEKESLPLKRLVLYTTRPIRQGEKEGREYHFIDVDKLNEFRAAGRVVEERTYQTVEGPWTYCTIHDDKMDLTGDSYLAIGTLESYVQMKAYYGDEVMVPLYVEVSDDIRLERALNRERKQETPRYQEMCRRFLADCQDFSEENIAAAGISRRFSNDGEMEECLGKLEECILGML